MTEAKHTPGPWEAQPLDVGGFKIVPVANPEFKVCRIEKAVTYLMAFDDEAEPDARLIAAAPDLLEALQELLKAADFIGSGVVDWSKWIDDAGNQARAAIAKATGAGQ